MVRGLSLREAYTSTQGEILDLMTCDAIAHGAKQKFKRTFQEMMKVR